MYRVTPPTCASLDVARTSLRAGDRAIGIREIPGRCAVRAWEGTVVVWHLRGVVAGVMCSVKRVKGCSVRERGMSALLVILLREIHVRGLC